MSTLVTKKSDHAGFISAEESVSEIAASISSKLAKSREGRSALTDEPPQACAFTEGSPTNVSGRQYDGTASTQIGPQILRDQPSLAAVTPDEYRKRFETCLLWMREVNADNVRLACLTLAQAWLSAAMGERENKHDKS
jgi:hypothetical protein